MPGVTRERLAEIYGAGDDPWEFRTSAYEQAKFRATRAALPRRHYTSGLEIGCGNGELARHLAPLCARYTGVDAVGAALDAARAAVPAAHFVQIYLPAELPAGDHDLIVLSEFLYFLDGDAIEDLAGQIDRRWPAADLVCVTWLGPSGNPLEGRDALDLFRAATARRFRAPAVAPGYRIDVAGAVA